MGLGKGQRWVSENDRAILRGQLSKQTSVTIQVSIQLPLLGILGARSWDSYRRTGGLWPALPFILLCAEFKCQQVGEKEIGLN